MPGLKLIQVSKGVPCGFVMEYTYSYKNHFDYGKYHVWEVRYTQFVATIIFAVASRINTSSHEAHYNLRTKLHK